MSSIALRREGVKEILTDLPREAILMDPFEFIRESHVATLFNNKSIYEIRKNIGREQADFLGCKMQEIDTAYAEPDYARPMTLGFSIKYQDFCKKFEMAEGIIKDRYDDADHMIDFSEQVSKNKLLTTGKSLKFIIQDRVRNMKIADCARHNPDRQHRARNNLLFARGRRETRRRLSELRTYC